MSNENPPPERSNTLGKASLVLGIMSLVLVFFVGSCTAIVQRQGGRISDFRGFVELFGGTFALIGLIAVGLGIGGLFGKNRPKATAIMGLIFGLIALLIAINVGKMFKG